MSTFVALLRGINVGGHNRLPMADLRDTASALGWSDVATYIQSGNLIFDSDDDDVARHASRLAAALKSDRGLSVPVLVRPAGHVRAAAERHPKAESGIDPKFLHVVFLSEAPGAAAFDGVDAERFAPDGWALDGSEIYTYYPQGSARSKLTIDVFEKAAGVTGTARNLSSLRRLVDLLDARATNSSAE